MSQNDLVIANQSFPSFRTDLNSALQAINTSQSGTSRPSGAVAGTIWLDTTSATSPTLKYYDGADDISLATIDHVGNTVNWLDSTVSVTGLTTTATGTVLTLSDTSQTSSVNLILQNQKEIRFSETTANGVNYVGFKAPASLSADKIWILPSADGTAGQFLKTDGAGNLSFDSLSFSTPLAVIGNATSGSEIRLPEDTDNGANYVAIKAPDTIASNLTLTLPSADGTSGQVLQTNGSGVLSFVSASGSKFGTQLFHVKDERSSGTNGQTLTGNSTYVTRVINTTATNEITSASVASNVISLPAGTYFVDGYIQSAGGAFNSEKGRIRNTTDGTTLLVSNGGYSWTADYIFAPLRFLGRFTISGTKNIEIQWVAGTGTKAAENAGFEIETYLSVCFWKIS